MLTIKTETMKKNITLTAWLFAISFFAFGQGGTLGNFSTGINFLGFNAGAPAPLNIRNNLPFQPINIFTNNLNIARFTSGNTMGLGDGLRIFDPTFPNITLDMWADNGPTNGTHVKFDGSGLIQGATSRFEVIGNFNGLWFNARRTNLLSPITPRILFNINDANNAPPSQNAEVARFSNDGNANHIGYMRIGFNNFGLDAARRLEVFDNINAPQFRITDNPGVTFTDFQTNGAGFLAILPSGNQTGISTNVPTNTLDINGTCRVSNRCIVISLCREQSIFTNRHTKMIELV